MFDLEKFDLKLNTDVIGRNFIYAEEVHSTNTELLTGSKLYKKHGTVLFAEKQKEGKGRKNRAWYSDDKLNLTFSILITEPEYFKKINLLNFVASLSLAVSIENLYQLRTDLKWPNDILIDNKKTAGILIESTSKGSRIDRLVIGIGLNVNQIAFQRKFTVEPTSLKKELGQPVEREKTLAEILNNMEEMLNSSINFPDKILEDWKAKCKMIGKRITVFNDDVTKQGIFNDIDKDGFIILRTDDKMETLHSGDVSIL